MFGRFMQGRYGTDQLNLAILALSLVSGFVSIAMSGLFSVAFSFVQLALIVLYLFRSFSKDYVKRRRENESFLRFWNRFRTTGFYKSVKNFFSSVSGFFSRLFDRQHKYFKCPNCKVRLRVPRGRGDITVTCPKCKNVFDKKS